MKKIFLLMMIFMISLVSLIAQSNDEVGPSADDDPYGNPEADSIGVTSAVENIAEVSVTKFEDAGFWKAYIASDDGIASIRTFRGLPAGVKKEQEEEKSEESDKAVDQEPNQYVLGTKISFYRRGLHSFYITPARPLPVEGICKTVSVWIAGRNSKHDLYLLIKDHFGNEAQIYVGKMTFSGWKEITVPIPPNIVQRDYHYNNKMGIQVVGFRIDCDLEESYGNFYMYLDDMVAQTDLYAEQNRDLDDMVDDW